MDTVSEQQPALSKVFYALPEQIQDILKNAVRSTDSDFLMLLMFYFSEECVLREKGWFESQRRGYPVDENGTAIPWYTYSAVMYLNNNLPENATVFEYGSGNSTLWYADRVSNVVAVEDSPKWAAEMVDKTPTNATVIQQSMDDGFVSEIENHGDFDVIVVDGKNRRSECAQKALNHLSDTGVIIWDDYGHLSEAECEPLLEAGFDVLPLFGIKPLCDDHRCTSIFYKEDNCLNI